QTCALPILNAFEELKLIIDDLKPEEFEQQLFLGLGFEPDAVDILTVTPGIDFNLAWQESAILEDSDTKIHIIAIDDLIKNKESMSRSGEKELLDKYDAAVLKKIKQQKS